MKKKLILLGVILFIGLAFAITDGISGTYSGTTTNAYVAAVDIQGEGYIHKYVHIENTGSTNAMLYKVYGYPTLTSTYYEVVVAETSIALSSSDDVKIANTAYAKLVIQVKWVDAATTYTADFNLVP